MRHRRPTFSWTVVAKHREPLIYLWNSGHLSFHREKGLEELIQAVCKFIKELMQYFTAPEKEAWKPTLQRLVFARRMRKESEETNRVKNLPL